MEKNIFVVKRSGEKEPFNPNKIKKVLKWATQGVDGINFDEVASHFEFNYTSDGITTENLHNSLISSCIDLITEETPDYQLVAGRLLNYALRKKVWGGINPPRLIDLVKQNIKAGYYDKQILDKYSTRDINKINEFIDHNRDLNFVHAGIKQLIDKYLVQDRETKEIFETPQFAYVLVAMTLFADEPKDRLNWIRRAYDCFSNFKINLATPVIAGARTPLRSFASCALFEVGDSMKSIGAHDYLFKKASAARYGLGFNISRLRPINAKIRHGDVLHTGLVPYLKNFESGIKATHQNGLRGSSGTVFINWWHYQVEDVISLKNNALPDERAVRFLDYCLCFSKLLRERIKAKANITLFNPNEVPELVENFGLIGWDDLYIKRESDPSVSKKIIPAMELMRTYARERLATGRIYSLDVDNINSQVPYLERVGQSNLCQEVTHPTRPSEKWDDENGQIGVCILSAINALNVKEDEFESVCEVMVRMLDNLIEYQDYFDLAASNFAKKYRSLGIGCLNFAAYLADNKIKYEDDTAPEFAARFAERLSFYCIKASINLAKERGKFEYFDKTKWSQGLLPVDRYNKNVDNLFKGETQDWNLLKEELLKHGIRNSTLTCYMPVESSSVISGSTSGLEPIRDYIVSKESKAGKLVVVAPKIKENKSYYTLAFDLKSTDSLAKIYAAINKYTCMSISANTYLNVAHYENKEIPLSVILRDTLYFFDLGGKTQYYCNTEDGGGSDENYSENDCSSGACKL